MPEQVKTTHYFTEFDDGSIEFTAAGKQELTPLFAQLDVDIDDVKTKQEADRLIDRAVAESVSDDDE